MHPTPQAPPPERSGPQHPRKIVTFYEDLPSAKRAHQTCEWMVQHPSDGRPSEATSWSFHMLGVKELASEIQRETASADVVLVSTRGDRDLPLEIAGWVDRCLTRERDAEPVVMLLFDAEYKQDGPDKPVVRSLNEIAARRKAKFVAGPASTSPLPHTGHHWTPEEWIEWIGPGNPPPA